jgi:hypothetical protein
MTPSYGPASAGIRVDSTTLELKVNPDGTERVFSGDSQYIINENVIATSVDNTIFTANADYQVVAVSYTPRVAGSDGSAVTAQIKKCTGTQAPSAGTSVTSDSANLKGTADTVQDLTLSTTTTDLQVADGERLAVDFTGTLTAAVGKFTVVLKKI